MQPLKTLTQTDFGDTQFVTGLRAYAAMLVIMIHAGGAGLRELGEIGNHIADLGATGVYMFFVISGFCISHSLQHNKDYKTFLLKRFWRIAPLYYAACIAALILLILFNIQISGWRESFGEQNLAYDIFMHATFLCAFDYRVSNALIGVEWSIPIEILWYLFIPFALPFMKTWKGASILLVLTCAIFAAKSLYAHIIASEMLSDAQKWSPLRYAPAFFLGMAAFTLRPWFLKTFPAKFLDAGLALLIIAASIELVFLQIGNEFLNILLLTAGIIAIGGTGKFSRTLFETKLIIFLGTISYSLYLTHMFVIAAIPEALNAMPFAKFLIISTLSVALSTLTYKFIEQNFIYRGVKHEGDKA